MEFDTNYFDDVKKGKIEIDVAGKRYYFSPKWMNGEVNFAVRLLKDDKELYFDKDNDDSFEVPVTLYQEIAPLNWDEVMDILDYFVNQKNISVEVKNKMGKMNLTHNGWKIEEEKGVFNPRVIKAFTGSTKYNYIDIKRCYFEPLKVVRYQVVVYYVDVVAEETKSFVIEVDSTKNREEAWKQAVSDRIELDLAEDTEGWESDEV